MCVCVCTCNTDCGKGEVVIPVLSIFFFPSFTIVVAPLETKSELKMNCETGSYVSHRQTEWERHTEDSFCLCLHEESDVGLSNLFSCVSVRGCTGCVRARVCLGV